MCESSRSHHTKSSVSEPATTRPEAPNRGGETPAKPGLGKTAKSVGRSDEKKRREARTARFRHQRHAAALLDHKERVGLCKHALVDFSEGVSVFRGDSKAGSKRAWFEGLQTCGSVWHCPVCAAKISEQRRQEMNKVFVWARSQGYAIKMITLTARHGIKDDLDPLLDALKLAKKKLHQHRAYKRLKSAMAGHITATEVTGGGRNGWHPHYHVIVILDRSELVDLEVLREPWLASLRGAGLDGAGAAFQVQDASQAQQYIAKWGAAEEMTLSGQKLGRCAESRTPAQLLADSCDENDSRAGALWREFARVFKGRRQLVWSRGLKELAGIDQVSDEEAAAADQEPEPELCGNVPSLTWNDLPHRRGACRRRGRILDAAELEGASGVFRETYAEGEDERPEGIEVIEEIDDHEACNAHCAHNDQDAHTGASCTDSERVALEDFPRDQDGKAEGDKGKPLLADLGRRAASVDECASGCAEHKCSTCACRR